MSVTQPHNMYLAKVPLLRIELEIIDVGQSVGEYYTQIQRMNNAFMPEDERKEGEEYFTKSDYKRYYAFKKFQKGLGL